MPRRRRIILSDAHHHNHSLDGAGEEKLKPSLDRFADDTSMLGFRYLHSKYKTWFRITWAFVLCFFMGLTFYQVGDRISYYFIYNPLTTIRSFDAPKEVPFPSLLICNKMQLKASRIAKLSEPLLKTLCYIYDDEKDTTTNHRNLSDFDGFDMRYVYASSMQTVDDLFLSCYYDKGRSCLEHVKPVLTPQGRCFTVSPNMTVRRPGPETTLTVLLNLETYEIIPGMVSEPGAIISIFDKSIPFSAHFAEGIHLDAGKAVSIPINDIRKLRRHSNNCGRRELDSFTLQEYTRAACQWTKVEKECECIPTQSPRNRVILSSYGHPEEGESLESEPENNSVQLEGDMQHPSPPPCTLQQETRCVINATLHHSLDFLDECPEDCREISFSSVVFGGPLMSSEVASLVRSDWEDDKEKRLTAFLPALAMIPNVRIPLVRAVQSLADDAQQFLQQSLRAFDIESESSSSAPCIVQPPSASTGARQLDRALHFLHGSERMWKHIANYVDLVMSPHLKSVTKLLKLNMTVDLETTEIKEDERENAAKVDLALFDLSNIESGLSRPQTTFGIRSMEPAVRVNMVKKVTNAVRAAQQCLQKARNTQNSRAFETIIAECHEIFYPIYSLLQSSRIVAASLDSQISAAYEQLSSKLISQLQKLRYKDTPMMFQWRNFDISVKDFEILYKEGGKDSLEIIELLKMRKLISVDLIDAINALILRLETIVLTRQAVLDGLELPNAANSSVETITSTVECLKQLPPKLLDLRKNSFLRADWMSRVQRQVEIAQSYSPGPKYDEVNLLLVKVYFAHFKQETIKQEKSYNLFLLLAEIGGTIGLYVGATLLTIAETIVFFFEKRTRIALLKNPAPL